VWLVDLILSYKYIVVKKGKRKKLTFIITHIIN
jgi:hypothetical protein